MLSHHTLSRRADSTTLAPFQMFDRQNGGTIPLVRDSHYTTRPKNLVLIQRAETSFPHGVRGLPVYGESGIRTLGGLYPR